MTGRLWVNGSAVAGSSMVIPVDVVQVNQRLIRRKRGDDSVAGRLQIVLMPSRAFLDLYQAPGVGAPSVQVSAVTGA